MNKFISYLENMKKRPGMFFIKNDLFEVCTFISGMDLMQEENRIHEDFSKWFAKNKLNIRTAVGWIVLVENYMKKNGIKKEDQVQEFFDILFEYLQERDSKI